MKLYDNDAYREEFMELVYSMLHGDGTNYRANLIIDAFDAAPEVEAEPLSPNDPLTLSELREMDGEPVWITDIMGGVVFREQWALIFSVEEDAICFSTKERGDDSRLFSLYGTGWISYRRKPEGD